MGYSWEAKKHADAHAQTKREMMRNRDEGSSEADSTNSSFIFNLHLLKFDS